MTDFDLQPCLDRQPGAWDAFVDRHARVIYSAIRKAMGPQADSDLIEDLSQDVFVRLVRDDMRTLRSFDPERGASLTTWLTIVARSVAIDEMRRRRLATSSLDSLNAEPTPRPAASVRHEQVIPTEVLTERQRLILVMLFDEQMTVQQAAQVLGVDEQTIRSTKHKALTRLREAMADLSLAEDEKHRQHQESVKKAGMPDPREP